jgi:hypothetical protein
MQSMGSNLRLESVTSPPGEINDGIGDHKHPTAQLMSVDNVTRSQVKTEENSRFKQQQKNKQHF